MPRLLRQRRLRGFLGSRGLTLALLVAAGAVSLAFGREVARRVSVKQELDRLTGNITQAEQSTRDLEKLIAALKSPTFQEGEARTQLNLQKPGEQVLVVPTNTSATDTVNGSLPARRTPIGSHESNVHRWWNYFFGTRST